jgi:hypothetical protein
MFDGDVFGKQMVEIVRGHVDRATAPLLERIDALEKRELLLPEKGDAGPQGEVGEKGEPGEVDMEAVKTLIDAAVAALPPAERGEKGEAGNDGLSGADGLPGADGKDGVGLADALIDKDGALVLTMTDGRTKNLGPVHGSDGAPGNDGADGLGFEHMSVEQVNERTIAFMFKRGEEKAEVNVTLPVLIGRGIWSAEGDYERGDVTTWGGTAWEAVEPVKGIKPDASSGGWRILAKRGRDGKAAK